MTTTAKTFAFLTTAESFVATAGTNITLSYDSTTGNPAGALKATTAVKNATGVLSYWEWTGTWEQLGVPAGEVVTGISMTSNSTRLTVATAVRSGGVNIGPYELRDSAGTLIGTLWAGRTGLTTADAAWVTAGAQSAVTVPNHPSTTTVKIRLADFIGTANTTGATVTAYDDQVALSITSVASTAYTQTPTDNAGLTDTRAYAVGKGPADPVGLTDAGTGITYTGTGADTVGLTDQATAVLTPTGGGGTSYTQTPADALGVTDTPTLAAGYNRTFTDNLGATDGTPATAVDHTEAPVDAAGLTDAATPAATYARTVTDALGATDQATTGAATAYAQTFTDALGATDTATPAFYSLTFTDVLGLDDPTGVGVGSAALYSDDFNRADGGLGSNWSVTHANPPTIVGNQMVGGAGSSYGIRWTTATATDNQVSQVTWKGGALNGVAVAMPTYANASGTTLVNPLTWYAFRQSTSTSVALFQKDVGALTSTNLTGNIARTLVAGDVLRLEYVNGVLNGYVNGTLVATHTPTTPITGQRYVGLTLVSATQSGVALFDDWSGGDVGLSVSQSVSDSVGLTDTAAPSVTYDRTVTDALGATDQVTTGASTAYTQNPADPVGLTDNAGTAAAYARTFTDALGAVDAATSSAATAYTQAPVDAAGLTDTASPAVTYGRTVTDPLAVTDTVTTGAATAYTQNPADAAGVTDTASSVSVYARTFTEALGASDTPSLTTGAGVTQTQTDTAGFTDSVTVALTYGRTFTDSLGAGDAASSALGYDRTATDPLGVTDQATPGAGYDRAATDALGVTDAATPATATAYTRTFTDPVGLDDTSSAVKSGLGTVSPVEALGITDAPTTRAITGTGSDPLGFTDSVSVLKAQDKAFTFNETLGISDPPGSVDVDDDEADALGFTDQVTISTSGSSALTRTDVAGLTDTFTIVVTKTPTDALTVSDTVDLSLTRVVTATDLMGWTDSTTRVVTKVQTATDRVGLTDTTTRVLTGSTTGLDFNVTVGPTRVGTAAVGATRPRAQFGVGATRSGWDVKGTRVGTLNVGNTRSDRKN